VQILDTAFLSPPFRGLGAKYTVHLKILWKARSGLPIRVN